MMTEVDKFREWAATFEATVRDPHVEGGAFYIEASGKDRYGQTWVSRASRQSGDEAAQICVTS